MDIEKLKILKTKGKNTSILVVEDCNLLQKQILTFLNKFFKNVYQAFDGEEGLEKFKKLQPDIVLTDLSMPKKSGLDMIKEIKLHKSDTKIIILSAHNEEEILMNVIKLNIDNFLLKPLNIDIFIDILINILGGDELNAYTQCIHDLELLHQQNGKVRLVNYFQEMIIEQEGEIVRINDHIITIKVPHTQILAIDNEGNTILELKSINKFMKFKLLNIDKETDTINLSRPMYIEYALKNNTHKRYFYNRRFSISLHDHHKYFELDVLDIVTDTITMYIDKEETDLVTYDNVNITIPLIFEDSSKNRDIFARSKITSIRKYKKGLKVVANMSVEEKDLLDFQNYLKKIEDEIIKELIER